MNSQGARRALRLLASQRPVPDSTLAAEASKRNFSNVPGVDLRLPDLQLCAPANPSRRAVRAGKPVPPPAPDPALRSSRAMRERPNGSSRSRAVNFDQLTDALLPTIRAGADGRYTWHPVEHTVTLAMRLDDDTELVLAEAPQTGFEWQDPDLLHINAEDATFSVPRAAFVSALDVNAPDQPEHRTLSVELINAVVLTVTTRYVERDPSED